LRERAQPEEERIEADDEPDRPEDVDEVFRYGEVAELEAERRCRRGESPERNREQRPHGRGVAGHVEAAAVVDERDEQEERDRRLFEVQPFREMCGRRCDHDDDGELPGAPSATRQRAREPDEGDAECERKDSRGGRHAGRQHPDQLGAVRKLRRQRRHDSDDSTPAAARARTDSGGSLLGTTRARGTTSL
jgi:hypothetical protein